MASSTRRNYAGHQAAWERWCTDGGVDPTTASAHDVALHLTWYLLGLEEPAVSPREANGGLVAAIATSTLHLRLAAIDKAFETAGRPRPGHDLEVKTLMQGVRRLFGVAPTHAKRPVLLEDLRRMLAVAREAQTRPLRDLVLVAAARQVQATPGQLARLNWGDVDLGGPDAYVTLAATRRGGPRARVRLRANGSADRCPVAALRDLRRAAGAGSAVFCDTAGRRLTRQAIDKRLKVLARTGVGGTSELSTKALRDAALLTCGWFAALRRSNLAALCWSDLTWSEEGSIRVRLRRSKTDQEGAGAWNWLPTLPGDPACPVAALTAWRSRIGELLGTDPCESMAGEPVFPAMTRHDQVKVDRGALRRLRGEGVNELVQELADRAALVPRTVGAPHPMGGHSLRAGFVTQACMVGVPLLDIAKVTHHADARSLAGYHRPADRASEKTVAAVVRGASGG